MAKEMAKDCLLKILCLTLSPMAGSPSCAWWQTTGKLYSLCGRSNTIYHGRLTFASKVHPGCLSPVIRRGSLLRSIQGPIPQAEMHSLWLQKDALVRRGKWMKDPSIEFNYQNPIYQKKREETPNYVPQGIKSTSGVFDKSYFMGLVSI